MIHQAVVSLLVSLATCFFCHIWALGSRLKLQFILQVKYHILTYKNDRRKKWFSCLVYDIRHKEWTV